jgi:beta-mannanase
MWWEPNTAGGRYTMAYTGKDKTITSLGQYKRAWAYVHHRAKIVNRATNVSFFFCANGSDVGGYTVEQYFPGAQYVDEVGFDTYNETRWAPWTSFDTKLRPMYDRVTALHATAPVAIGELGTVDTGGPVGANKATWLQDMFTSTSFPRLKHVDFFSVNQGRSHDWRLNQTAAAIAVCKKHLAHAPQDALLTSGGRG